MSKKKEFANIIYGLSLLIIGIVVAILIIGGTLMMNARSLKGNLENNFLGEKWSLSECYDEVNEIKYQDETYEMEKSFYKFSDENFSGKLYYKETENGLLCIFVGSKAFLQLT